MCRVFNNSPELAGRTNQNGELCPCPYRACLHPVLTSALDVGQWSTVPSATLLVTRFVFIFRVMFDFFFCMFCCFVCSLLFCVLFLLLYVYCHRVETKLLKSKQKAIPLQALTGRWGSRRLWLLEFLDNRYRKVVRLSALRTGRLYPLEIFLVLISVRG